MQILSAAFVHPDAGLSNPGEAAATSSAWDTPSSAVALVQVSGAILASASILKIVLLQSYL